MSDLKNEGDAKVLHPQPGHTLLNVVDKRGEQALIFSDEAWARVRAVVVESQEIKVERPKKK